MYQEKEPHLIHNECIVKETVLLLGKQLNMRNIYRKKESQYVFNTCCHVHDVRPRRLSLVTIFVSMSPSSTKKGKLFVVQACDEAKQLGLVYVGCQCMRLTYILPSKGLEKTIVLTHIQVIQLVKNDEYFMRFVFIYRFES